MTDTNTPQLTMQEVLTNFAETVVRFEACEDGTFFFRGVHVLGECVYIIRTSISFPIDEQYYISRDQYVPFGSPDMWEEVDILAVDGGLESHRVFHTDANGEVVKPETTHLRVKHEDDNVIYLEKKKEEDDASKK